MKVLPVLMVILAEITYFLSNPKTYFIEEKESEIILKKITPFSALSLIFAGMLGSHLRLP